MRYPFSLPIMWIPLLSTPCTLSAYIIAVTQPYLLGGDPAVTFSLDIVFYLGVGEQLLLIGLLPYYNYNYFIPLHSILVSLLQIE